MSEIVGLLAGIVLLVLVLLVVTAIHNPDGVKFCEDNGYTFQGKIFFKHQCEKVNEMGELQIREIGRYDGNYHFVELQEKVK